MGNRASISIENCSNGIYLHWNGGRGSVIAFIEEANKRYTASRHGQNTAVEIKDDHYLMELYACIREYFNFAGKKEYRGRDSLSLYLSTEKYDCENGHYYITEDGEIDYKDTFYTNESHEYTEESYKSIARFFEQSEQVMLKTEWGEKEEPVLNLFESDQPAQKTFSDFAKSGDRKGAVDYLRNLKQKDFFEEVVQAGYSMIGFHHGKSEVMQHVLSQIE